MLSAQGRVIWTTGCEVLDASEKDGVLSFTRVDRVLPVLPPGPLPPRGEVPMEALSSYQLRVVGLEVGDYEIRCQGKPVGTADNQSLALGVNLNSLLLDSGNEAPWADVAEAVWEGQTLEQVGPRAWRFEVRKRPGPPTAVDGDGAPGIP